MFGKWFQRPASTKIDWPDLPKDGFLSVCFAKAGDVERGYAVFSQPGSDKASVEPSPTVVPQYAFWLDEVGIERPAVVIQAERNLADESEIVFGLRLVSGRVIAAFGNKVRLLGTTLPGG